MENVPWNGLNYTSVSKKIKNDPVLKKKESHYILKHVRSSKSGNPKVNCDTHINPNWFDTPIFNKNEYRIVRNRAISKVEDELTLFTNLLESIYERQEAYTMLLKAGKQVLFFLRGWRNPRYWRKTLKRAPKNLPSAWLAYNFGLMPLVGSINDALNILGGDIPSFMVRGTAGTKVNIFDSAKNHYDGWTRSTKANLYFSFRAYIEPEINPNRGLANILGLTTPFSTAFSVIPWGWAVDYFVNVSDLLGNYENKFPGVKVKEVWETQIIKGTCATSTYNVFIGGGHAFNNGHFVYARRLQSRLNKQLTFSFPTIGGNQAANLFSAIALSMKGK